jgi:hypothetical protein
MPGPAAVPASLVADQPVEDTDEQADVLDEAAWAELLAEPVGGDVDLNVDVTPTAAPVVAPEPVLASVARPVKRLGRVDAAAQRTAVLPAVDPEPVKSQVTRWEGWRIVPDSAPSLLLSATDLLDARDPGPVLSPGARYRVASVQNGVVGLHVAAHDGEVGLGYCAAVDLICIDPRFSVQKPGRSFGFSAPQLKSKVQRITGSLSEAATSLLG